MLVIGIFAIAVIYARRQGPVEVDTTPDSLKEKAEALLAEESNVLTGKE